ncbi:MAG TPA: hypothetical protein VFV96_06325 [Verrucomicrobiae bacterium]|nr:hypothetical protein [Verrucomicrobiae bacterium]
MKPRVRQVVALGLSVMLTGCYTTENHFARIVNEPGPVPPAVQSQFGVMGVLSADAAAQFQFTRPDDVGEAMGEIGAGSFAVLAKSAVEDEDASAGEKLEGVAFSAVLAVAAGVVGGLLTGVPEADLKRAQKEVQQALVDNPVEPGIGAQLLEIARVAPATNVVAVPGAVLTRLSQADLAQGNFRALAGSGIDSVLILRAVDQGFATERSLNPVMAVDLKLQLEVVRVADGAVLFANVLEYRGERRQFTRWGAHHARLFRAEIKAAQRTFAAVVFDELGGDASVAPPK